MSRLVDVIMCARSAEEYRRLFSKFKYIVICCTDLNVGRTLSEVKDHGERDRLLSMDRGSKNCIQAPWLWLVYALFDFSQT
jgi:hypothetical protein